MGFQFGYFDGAGDRAAASAQTVGGFIAPERSWKKFSRDWRSALGVAGVRAFHMTDVIAARGEFVDWRQDSARQQRLLRALTKVIRKHVHCGVSSTVLLDDWRALNERFAMKECHVSPYGLASFSVVSKSVLWVGSKRPNDLFVPVFEMGDTDRGDREHLLGWMRELSQGRLDELQTVEDEKESPALQAADLAVWEHRFAVRGRLAGAPRKLREPLEDLLRIESSHGVIQREQLLEHAARLGVPSRAEWTAWSQRERALWRPKSFNEGKLYGLG